MFWKRLQDNLVWLAVVAVTIGAITVANEQAASKANSQRPDQDPAEIRKTGETLDQQLEQVRQQMQARGIRS